MVTLLLVVVWVGSARWRAGWSSRNLLLWVAVEGGRVIATQPCLLVDDSYTPGDDIARSSVYLKRNSYGFRWWLHWQKHSGVLEVAIPMWVLAAIVLVPTTAAWRLDSRPCRRARIGLCLKCNYNRHGIPAQAVCPECGAAPVAALDVAVAPTVEKDLS